MPLSLHVSNPKSERDISMKHVVFLADGMADQPVPALNGKTPLEVAKHPNMDRIARYGRFGTARTVPEHMPAGSDTANLSVFGYDPEVYYSGRSPLEAAYLGIEMSLEDVTYRCNLVTLSDADTLEDATMVDYSCGEIETEDAREIIESLAPLFVQHGAELYCGTKYRHCLVLRNAETGTYGTPPHDIPRQPIAGKLPTGGSNEALLNKLTQLSFELLKDHPVNKRRVAAGKKPASCCWFWGEGRKPALSDFTELYGVKGGVISAVDLLRGIARCANVEVLPVDGVITGDMHTDFAAKGRAAIEAMKNGCEMVYLHVEATDECGHHAQTQEKIWSIEQIDKHVIGPVLEYLDGYGEDYSVMVLPDHPTPIVVQTHTHTPVPFALMDTRKPMDRGETIYTEANAVATGEYVPKACTLMGDLTAK